MVPERVCRPAGEIRPVLLPLSQNIQGKVLQIDEIDQMFLFFDFQKAFSVFHCKGGKCLHRPAGSLHHCKDGLRTLPSHSGTQLSDPVLDGVSHGLHRIFERRIDIFIFFASGRRKTLEAVFDRALDLLPELLI